MKITISGRTFLSNDEKSPIQIQVSSKILTEKKEIVQSTCSIFEGNILVDLEMETPFEDDIDEYFRYARHVVDGVILTEVASRGIGIQYILNHVETDSDQMILMNPDMAPSDDDEQAPVFSDVLSLIGKIPDLRYAIRDYNSGLIDRENCPLLFYRAIETLAKVICETNKINEKQWKNFHEKLGTQFEDLSELYEINKPHRHGERRGFSRDMHLKMMSSTRKFIYRALNYLNENNRAV